VARAFVPLPSNNTLAVKLDWPMPPLATVKGLPRVKEAKEGVAGKVKVWAVPDEVMVNIEPEEAVANVWVAPVRPFKELMPPLPLPQSETVVCKTPFTEWTQ